MVRKNMPPNVIGSRRPVLVTVLLMAVISAAVVFAGCAGPATSGGGGPTPWGRNSVSSGASTRFASLNGQADNQTGDPIGVFGTIQKLPDGTGLQGAWKVNGLTVYATSNTQIDQQLGPVSIGAEVELMGWLQSDGSMKAGWIRVLAPLKQANAEGDAGASIPWPNITTLTPTKTPRPGITVPTGTSAPRQDAASLQGSSTIGVSQSIRSWGNIQRMLGIDASGMWQVGGGDALGAAQAQVGQQSAVAPVGGYGYVLGWALPDGTIEVADIDVTPPALGQDGNGAYLQNTVQHRLLWHAMLQELPQNGLLGTWVVGGINIVVDSSTQTVGRQADIRPGNYLRVTGWLQDDGSIHAQKVELGEVLQFAAAAPSLAASAFRDTGAGSLRPANNPYPAVAREPQGVSQNVSQSGGGDVPDPGQASSNSPDSAQPTATPQPPTSRPPTAQPTLTPLPPTAEPTPSRLLPTVQPTATPLPPAAEPKHSPPPPLAQPTTAPEPPVTVPRPVFAPPAQALPQNDFGPGSHVPQAKPGNGQGQAKDPGAQGNKDQDKGSGKAKDQGGQGNKDQGKGTQKAKDQGDQGNKDQDKGNGKAKGHK